MENIKHQAAVEAMGDSFNYNVGLTGAANIHLVDSLVAFMKHWQRSDDQNI